jgi:hypothetical protein
MRPLVLAMWLSGAPAVSPAALPAVLPAVSPAASPDAGAPPLAAALSRLREATTLSAQATAGRDALGALGAALRQPGAGWDAAQAEAWLKVEWDPIPEDRPEWNSLRADLDATLQPLLVALAGTDQVALLQAVQAHQAALDDLVAADAAASLAGSRLIELDQALARKDLRSADEACAFSMAAFRGKSERQRRWGGLLLQRERPALEARRATIESVVDREVARAEREGRLGAEHELLRYAVELARDRPARRDPLAARQAKLALALRLRFAVAVRVGDAPLWFPGRAPAFAATHALTWADGKAVLRRDRTVVQAFAAADEAAAKAALDAWAAERARPLLQKAASAPQAASWDIDERKWEGYLLARDFGGGASEADFPGMTIRSLVWASLRDWMDWLQLR